MENDERLPHIALRIDRRIAKTALSAEKSMAWEHISSIETALQHVKRSGYVVVALEQAPDSIPMPAWHPPAHIAILLGNEVTGVPTSVLTLCDTIVEIPMFGQKESFNVATAAAMALYKITFGG